MVALVVCSFFLWCTLIPLTYQMGNHLVAAMSARDWPFLQGLMRALADNSLSRGEWRSQGRNPDLLFGLAFMLLTALWGGTILWSRRAAICVPLLAVLGVVVLLSLPLLWLPRLTSGDVFLYMFYGHTLADLGGNPMVTPPGHYVGDPLLQRVHWKYAPSAYGPLWLFVSSGVNNITHNSIALTLLGYKILLLAFHLVTTAAVWACLRRARPEWSLWGAIFYGLNPFILFETVGNGHNDVMMAAFVVLALFAASRNRWLLTVCLLTAAAMVKLNALLLLPALIIYWLARTPNLRAKVIELTSSLVVFAVTAVAIYVPLWAGPRLVTNVLHNPAARNYFNSVWWWAGDAIAAANGSRPGAVWHSMTLPRNLLLGICYLAIVYLFAYHKRDLPAMFVWLWLVYCVTASWIWPWYFVLLVPIAALSESRATVAVAVGATIGGLLFNIGWPGPPLHGPLHLLFDYRWALLLVPVPLALIVWGIAVRGRGAERRNTLAVQTK